MILEIAYPKKYTDPNMPISLGDTQVKSSGWIANYVPPVPIIIKTSPKRIKVHWSVPPFLQAANRGTEYIVLLERGLKTNSGKPDGWKRITWKKISNQTNVINFELKEEGFDFSKTFLR